MDRRGRRRQIVLLDLRDPFLVEEEVLQRFEDTIRRETIEECARVAMAIGVVQSERDGSEAHPDYDTQAAIAAAIRALVKGEG